MKPGPLPYDSIADLLLDEHRDSDEMHDFAREVADVRDGQWIAMLALPVALAEPTEYQRGWTDCMALWADHMKRMNDALAKPLPAGYANHAYYLFRNVREALNSAPVVPAKAAVCDPVQSEEPSKLEPSAADVADAQQLVRAAIAVSDWLAGGCDVHDIPRPQIAVLVALTKEVGQRVLIKG